MNIDTQNNSSKPSDEGLATAACSPWHIWYVDNFFIAHTTLKNAVDFYVNDMGINEEEINWEDINYDDADYYREKADGEREIVSHMRGQAEVMISEGESIPFTVAYSDH